MPARATIGHDVPRWCIGVLLLALVGCLSPHEPEPASDRVPPRQPSLALLRARVPDAQGVAWISGAAGCVEADVHVEVRDSGLANPRAVSGQASGAGAFEIAFTADRLAPIEVVCIDAAGNASRAAVLAIGAPFGLAPLCSDTPATAGDSLGIQAAVRLTDESGAVVPDVDVSFFAATLSTGPVTATTGADGVAVWSTTTTRAGGHALAASVAPALLANTATCTLQVQPAAVSGLEAVTGGEQVGAPAGLLRDALVCRAVDRFGNGVPDHTVTWMPAAGSVSSPTSVTDARGEAAVRWTLPAVAGEWQVTATLSQTGSVATFTGIAGGPPVIDALTPDPATPGDDLVLAGGPFSRDAGYDEVWFESNGLDHPAEIRDAGLDRLVVRVPDAATSGSVHVRVCGREAVPADVRIELALGAVVDLPVGGPLRLETPGGSEEFVVGLFTAATEMTPFQIGSVSAKPGAITETVHAVDVLSTAEAGADAFHAWLRQHERRTRNAPQARPAAAAKPMSQRTFSVLADLSGSSYATVTATLRYTGTAVHVYVDDRVPASDLSDASVAALGDRFAAVAYGTVVGAFGATSDVDADGHVLVLLTPTVNQLTPPGSGAFVGGFFFAQDLHNVVHSNRAEMLYTMVPDPTGRWGNVFTVQNTLDVLDGVLPHELQHLINYNQRVLVRHADPEDLWLNEALSHVAEGLCGEMQQNQLRANRFLANPHLVSLTAGGNALAERGMSFLFVRFVADQQDGAFLRRLVQTTRAGVDNVEQASGRSLDAWLRDWVAALILDHVGLAEDPRFHYASIDFAGDFSAPYQQGMSLESPSAAGSLQPTGCRFYRLAGTATLHTDLTASGARAILIRVR